MRTSPSAGRDSDARMRRKVVLPAPLGPSKATNSPVLTSKSSPRRTVFKPKRLTSLPNSDHFPDAHQLLAAAAFNSARRCKIGIFGQLALLVEIIQSQNGIHDRFVGVQNRRLYGFCRRCNQ